MKKPNSKLINKVFSFYKEKIYRYRLIYFILLLIGLIFIGLKRDLPSLLFEKEPALGEYVKLIGALIGGSLVIIGLWLNNKRISEQTRQNNISEKAQLNTRFKDAAMLLADNNTSANLSAIYALHQIAIESYRGNDDQKSYVNIIQEIFNAFLIENSVSDDHGIIKRQKSTILFQTIVEILFNDTNTLYNTKQIRLAAIDLSHIDFSYKYLHGISFQKADLHLANLSHADLSEGNFMKSKMTKTNLEGANLSLANLSDVYLIKANLSNTKFIKTNLSGATLSEIDMTSKDMSEVNLSNATISKSTFNNAILSRAILYKVFLSETSLTNVNLENADLSDARLSKVDLSKSDLSKANLYEANLSGTYLSKAKLTNAQLIGTNLSKAILTETNLSGADLSGANLSETDLTKANLSGADLTGANLSSAIFIEANLSGAIFEDIQYSSGYDSEVDFSYSIINDYTKINKKILKKSYKIIDINTRGNLQKIIPIGKNNQK